MPEPQICLSFSQLLRSFAYGKQPKVFKVKKKKKILIKSNLSEQPYQISSYFWIRYYNADKKN